ncbi:hypothetical protein DRW48_07880 [Paracoccus suum]|uniref:Excalibur calcium-binding domain-containing protein n=1 Tax=Paracoccus suum TaxID=2259340 RepID=A0A344PP49_9RHOB|nr:hypothetical protein [Paracoccus suum]AXC51154.1 hypothetical protein DRW48_07880 [Paracoccus suum]
MRKAICLMVLALAACGENNGWNPNYVVADRPYGTVFDETTPYAQYKVQREKALIGQRAAPKTVPIARPFKAPTAQEIAGPNLWQIISGEARAVTGQTVIQPGGTVRTTTVVAAPADGAAVLSRYASATVHQPGKTVWRRSAADPAAAARICRSYATPDAAQIAFLAKGGPEADPALMDPDGDGFVCGWDPRPWRRSAGL